MSAGPHIVVFASGEGTTAEAAAKLWSEKPGAPSIDLILTNNPNAGILKKFPNVESAVIDPNDEEGIIKKIESGNYNLIWLAGYMKKIGPKIVQRFGWHSDYNNPCQAMMVNMHPGLLPATKGLYGAHVQEFVLKNKIPAGHTLHIVSEDYDEGPIIAEHMVVVEKEDTPETLFERIKASERKYLPQDLEDFIQKRRLFWQDLTKNMEKDR